MFKQSVESDKANLFPLSVFIESILQDNPDGRWCMTRPTISHPHFNPDVSNQINRQIPGARWRTSIYR